MSSAASPYVAAITDALHAMLPDGYEGQRAAGCEIHRDDTVTQPGHTSAPVVRCARKLRVPIRSSSLNAVMTHRQLRPRWMLSNGALERGEASWLVEPKRRQRAARRAL